MKIAAVSMIKDECDIIESFVRINARWADHFFILDNGSTDATPHILRRLSEEGIRITVVRDPSVHYNQGKMTTAMVKRALASGDFDFVFPIDGDEFVDDAERFKQALHATGKDGVPALEWKTLVPKHGEVMRSVAPLADGFSRRRTEVRRIVKIVLPVHVAKNAALGMGNHTASGKDKSEFDQVPIDIPLFHVPVRSKEQIIAKTLVGSHKMSIKVDRKKDEVFHWDMIAKFLRANSFDLTDEQLRDIALGYGWSEGDPKVRETVPISIGGDAARLQYGELAHINLAQLLDGFIGALCDEIRVGRSSARLGKRLLRRLAQSW